MNRYTFNTYVLLKVLEWLGWEGTFKATQSNFSAAKRVIAGVSMKSALRCSASERLDLELTQLAVRAGAVGK